MISNSKYLRVCFRLLLKCLKIYFKFSINIIIQRILNKCFSKSLPNASKIYSRHFIFFKFLLFIISFFKNYSKNIFGSLKSIFKHALSYIINWLRWDCPTFNTKWTLSLEGHRIQSPSSEEVHFILKSEPLHPDVQANSQNCLYFMSSFKNYFVKKNLNFKIIYLDYWFESYILNVHESFHFLFFLNYWFSNLDNR